MPAPRFGTFSIVACDRDAGLWGVAVQSRFISVGAVVPFARAGVGAIATQAAANVRYGTDGLRLLAEGASASDAVRTLTEADPARDERQLGIVDARGGADAYTGAKCLDWAGHRVGDGYCCQGNILFGPEVVRAMARTYEATPGDLVDRLLAALVAGQREGGDRRGMQSAALLVVRRDGGYGGGNDRWIDVRVDDHPAPIEELKRIFKLYDLTMLTREDPATLVPIAGDTALALQHDLGVLGYYTGRLNGRWDVPSQEAFRRFLHEHNFENKERTDDRTWPSIVAYLKERAAAETARRTTTAPIVPGALDRGPGSAPHAGGAPSSPPPAKRTSSG
ncbi:MAG TPA: DUF1028 domain-containing protein [Thermoplasmata archaeon]|jgi:uncharacterized Ntn-hydrolase superfamily protein|nr:DUF1028 domain-containing protein [Thermoplasmata archaeon]